MNLRYVGRQRYGKLRDSFAEDALDSLPGRVIPPGKCNASAGLNGAHTLRDCGLGPGKMSEAESTDDGVKGTICKWKMFDVGFTKLDGWM